MLYEIFVTPHAFCQDGRDVYKGMISDLRNRTVCLSTVRAELFCRVCKVLVNDLQLEQEKVEDWDGSLNHYFDDGKKMPLVNRSVLRESRGEEISLRTEERAWFEAAFKTDELLEYDAFILSSGLVSELRNEKHESFNSERVFSGEEFNNRKSDKIRDRLFSSETASPEKLFKRIALLAEKSYWNFPQEHGVGKDKDYPKENRPFRSRNDLRTYLWEFLKFANQYRDRRVNEHSCTVNAVQKKNEPDIPIHWSLNEDLCRFLDSGVHLEARVQKKFELTSKISEPLNYKMDRVMACKVGDDSQWWNVNLNHERSALGITKGQAPKNEPSTLGNVVLMDWDTVAKKRPLINQKERKRIKKLREFCYTRKDLVCDGKLPVMLLRGSEKKNALYRLSERKKDTYCTFFEVEEFNFKEEYPIGKDLPVSTSNPESPLSLEQKTHTEYRILIERHVKGKFRWPTDIELPSEMRMIVIGQDDSSQRNGEYSLVLMSHDSLQDEIKCKVESTEDGEVRLDVSFPFDYDAAWIVKTEPLEESEEELELPDELSIKYEEKKQCFVFTDRSGKQIPIERIESASKEEEHMTLTDDPDLASPASPEIQSSSGPDFDTVSGTIKKGTINLLTDKGYGFISTEDKPKRIFFHRSDCQGVAYNDLHKGQTVIYTVGQNHKGPCAKNVQLADD